MFLTVFYIRIGYQKAILSHVQSSRDQNRPPRYLVCYSFPCPVDQNTEHVVNLIQSDVKDLLYQAVVQIKRVNNQSNDTQMKTKFS